MSRSTHFEQSYFTNFQGGQEFSGSSGAAAKQDGLLYLSETWFSLARCGPCAGVLYNEKLGSYVSCYMADVSGPGDTRLKVWVHAALPDGSGAGTFRDCLQWPFDRFVRNVRLYKMPEAVAVTAERVSCADVIRRYDLADERLAGLMKIVFCSLLTSGQSVKIGLPADNAQPGSLYTEACDVMALICELTPEKKRDRLGFAAGAAVRAAETPFVFCPEGGSDGQIDLRSSLPQSSLPWMKALLPASAPGQGSPLLRLQTCLPLPVFPARYTLLPASPARCILLPGSPVRCILLPAFPVR